MRILSLALIGCVPKPTEGPSHTTPPEPLSPLPTTTEGGQSGEDPGYGSCEGTVVSGEAGDVVVGADGPFTAAELRTLADGMHTAQLTWSDGAETILQVELLWDGPIRLINTAYGGSASYCDPRIEMEGTYALQTDDGLLDETGAAVLIGRRGTEGQFGAAWRAEDLGGTLVVPKGSVLDLSVQVEVGLRGTLEVSETLLATFSPR